MNRRIFISSIFSAAATTAMSNFEKALGQSVENKKIIKSEGVFVESKVILGDELLEEIYDFKVLRADHPDSRGHIYSKKLLQSLADNYPINFHCNYACDKQQFRTIKGNLILEDKCKLLTGQKYKSISLGSENKFDDYGSLFIANHDVYSHTLKNFYIDNDYLIARIAISPSCIQKPYSYSPESIRLFDCLKNHTIPITMRIAGLGSFEQAGKYINVSDDFQVLSINAVPIDKAVKIDAF